MKKIFDVLMGIKAEVVNLMEPHIKQIEPDLALDSQERVELPKELPIKIVPIKDNPGKISTVIAKVKSTAPETRYFQIEDGDHHHKIAYTVSGDMDAENILLCLPGLLETKASFLVIHAYFLKFDNCKVISIDFSGRGESDYIDDRSAYKMSLYLSLIHI